MSDNGPRKARYGVTRSLRIAGFAVVLTTGALAIFLLKPDNGPARNLSVAGDATRGAYLIRLGGCVSCHTDHAHNAPMLAGGRPLATPLGVFYAPNITPDKETGIGNWTVVQFSNAISNGDGPHGNLYPVFPYTEFTLMSDQEVVDLYAALMAVPPVKSVAPENRITPPLNIRLFVSAWKNLFFTPRRYRNEPARSISWNRGSYLANGPGHCVACHSPRNVLFAVVAGREFTGNPAGGLGGKAPNITSLSLRGGGYNVGSLSQTLQNGMTPSHGRVGAEMGEVIRDETSFWTSDDLSSLSTYLLDQK